jgi:hypothetical protein
MRQQQQQQQQQQPMRRSTPDVEVRDIPDSIESGFTFAWKREIPIEVIIGPHFL